MAHPNCNPTRPSTAPPQCIHPRQHDFHHTQCSISPVACPWPSHIHHIPPHETPRRPSLKPLPDSLQHTRPTQPQHTPHCACMHAHTHTPPCWALSRGPLPFAVEGPLCINLLLPFLTLARILSYTGRRRVYSWGKDLWLTSKGWLICWLHLLFPAKMSEPILNSREPVAWMEGQSGPILVSLPSWQQGMKWPSLCDQTGSCPDSVFWGTASLDEPRASGNHQKQDDNTYFSA